MGWFSDLFRKKKILTLPLEFSLAMDSKGTHHIKVYYNIEGTRHQIPEIMKLSYYGFKVETETAVYHMSIDDLQKVYSILSLNPIHTSDGESVVEMTPSVLSYLRQKGASENETSKAVKIKTIALSPFFQIDGQVETGLSITIDYIDKASGARYREHTLSVSRDPNYLRVKDAFYPIATQLHEQARKLLDYNNLQILPEDIPKFFRDELPVIQKYFSYALAPALNSVVIHEKPLERIFTLTRAWDDGIDIIIRLFDRDNNRYVSDEKVQSIPNCQYDRVDTEFFPSFKPRSESEATLLEWKSRHINPDTIPEFMTNDLTIIQSAFSTMMDDSVKQISVVNKYLKPAFKMDLSEDRITFSITYWVGEVNLTHENLINKTQKFIHPDKDHWILIDADTLISIDEKLKQIPSLQAIDTGYGIDLHQFHSLEKVIKSIDGSIVMSDRLQQYIDTMVEKPSKEEKRIETQLHSPSMPSRFEAVSGWRPTFPTSPSVTVSDTQIQYLTPNQISRKKMLSATGSTKYPRIQIQQSAFTRLSFKSMEKIPDLSAPYVPLKAYLTTYKDMNQEQYAWYLRWRHEWLNGKPMATDLSYLSLFSYELINFLIIPEMTKSYRALETLLTEYKESCPQVMNYLPGWLGDLAWELGLENEAVEWWRQSPNDRDNIELVRFTSGPDNNINNIFVRYPYPPTAHTKKYPKQTVALFEAVAKDVEEYSKKLTGYPFEYLLGTRSGGYPRTHKFFQGAIIVRKVEAKPVKERIPSTDYSAWRKKAFIEFFNAAENLQRAYLSHFKPLLVEENYLDKVLLKYIREELPKFAKVTEPVARPTDLDMALVDEISRDGEIFEKEIDLIDASEPIESLAPDSENTTGSYETISGEPPIEVEIIENNPAKIRSGTPISGGDIPGIPESSKEQVFDSKLLASLSLKDESFETELENQNEDLSEKPETIITQDQPIELASLDGGALNERERNFINQVISYGAYPVSEARKIARQNGLLLDAFVEGLNEKGMKNYGYPFVLKGDDAISINPDIGQSDIEGAGLSWNQPRN